MSDRRWANDGIFIVLLAVGATFLIILTVLISFAVIPQVDQNSKKIDAVCSSAEIIGDDREASIRETLRALGKRNLPGDDVLRTNAERSSRDMSEANSILDRECD